MTKKFSKLMMMGATLLITIGVVVTIIAMTEAPKKPNKIKPGVPIVCIDAGHGGKDTGAIGINNRLEKDDCLRLALQVRDALEKKGVSVIMTREEDVYLTLEERCQKANQNGADLFVSLHRNSAEGANGVEIWTHKAQYDLDTKLAENILTELSIVGVSENRGVRFGIAGKKGNYYVNVHTDMPSCLVEMGFVTSDKDNQLLDEHLSQYANAIADGILNTLAEMQN